MILDLLVDEKQDISQQFIELFSKVNFVYVDHKRRVEAQVSEIEEELGPPSFQRMLVYSTKYNALGTVLSRRYVNAAKIKSGPLILANMMLSPDHISSTPNIRENNKILFLAPHFDEAYLAAILLHKLSGDNIYLYSFSFPKEYRKRIENTYNIFGLKEDDYYLDTLKTTTLYKEKKVIKGIIRELLNDFKPNVVFSVFPEGANFDHMSIAQVAKEVVLTESTADLIYGYVIQSRNKNPIIFPIYSASIYNMILRVFGKDGFGDLFEKYLPFLNHYMKTLSEPLLRMMHEKDLNNIYSLPLEAERIHYYKIPNLLNEEILDKILTY